MSLATDSASEAIYPLLPFFLTHLIGATTVSLGVIEGAAEATNSLLKIVSGWLADRTRQERPLILLGYGLSSAIRPLMALAATAAHVFVVRILDRTGKGIRGAPRDAMLSTWATPTTRGRVYGLQRGMDHLGAVIGPALATLFLLVYPRAYRTLFAWTIVPGAISVVLILFVPSENGGARPPGARTASDEQVRVRGVSGPVGLPRRFYLFTGVLVLFTLGNSSDAFLLLRLTDAVGGGPRFVPLMWSALHIVKASVSIVSGGWSDRVGRRSVIGLGWVTYAIVYAGFALSGSLHALLAWFLLYGFYFGFAEATERALVADLAPVISRGTAFGIYNAVQGLGALVASVVFGVIWRSFGAPAAFGLGSALAIIATLLLFVVVPSRVNVERL